MPFVRFIFVAYISAENAWEVGLALIMAPIAAFLFNKPHEAPKKTPLDSKWPSLVLYKCQVIRQG
jgi:hypothetical protein